MTWCSLPRMLGSEAALVGVFLMSMTLCCCGGSLYFREIPDPPCPMETLLIDDSSVPKELDSVDVGDPVDRFGVEFQQISFYGGVFGNVIQTVYRDWTKREASRGYDDLVETYFSPDAAFFCNDVETKWETPSEFASFSPGADQWQLGCLVGCSTGENTCQFIAQYGVYVVWSYADLSAAMASSDYEQIVQDIDRRMTECINPSELE